MGDTYAYATALATLAGGGVLSVPVRISSSPHGAEAVGTALGGYRRNGEPPIRLLPHDR